MPRFHCSKVSRFQGSKIPRPQGSKAPRFQGSKVPRFQPPLIKWNEVRNFVLWISELIYILWTNRYITFLFDIPWKPYPAGIALIEESSIYTKFKSAHIKYQDIKLTKLYTKVPINVRKKPVSIKPSCQIKDYKDIFCFSMYEFIIFSFLLRLLFDLCGRQNKRNCQNYDFLK